MRKRDLVILLLVLLAAAGTAFTSGCGRQTVDLSPTTTLASGDSGDDTSTTLPPSEDPIRIVFNGEISGGLVYDTALVSKGVNTALEMLGNRLADWSIDYQEIDNKGDSVLAVQQTRELVQTDTDDDGKKDREAVDFICGPLSSSDVAAITYFLAQREDETERVPQCSVTGQPRENITTSGDVGFIPNGIYSSYGYYLGKFAAETMHFKTVNCIHYADRIAEEMQAGFERSFTASGGTITSLTYVPSTTVDFAPNFASMLPADCTMFWIRGTGAIPFVSQYAASGLTGQLLVPQSSNYSESQLEYLQALGLNVDMIACDVYTPMLDNAANSEFIAAYQKLYPGDYPTPEVFGGWQAIMLYGKAVETLASQRSEGIRTREGELVDPRNPVDVIAMMSTLSMDTPAGAITMSEYGKTYVATRDFYILRSRDAGGGRVAWAPLYTYSQVLMGQ